MVVIRLSRGGTNKRPFYHVVVADSRRSRDGNYLERLGFYNPIASGPDVYMRLNKERISYWLSKGAQASERVADLIKEYEVTGEITGAQYAEKIAPIVAKKAKAKAAKVEKAAAEKAAAEKAAAPLEETQTETQQ